MRRLLRDSAGRCGFIVDPPPVPVLIDERMVWGSTDTPLIETRPGTIKERRAQIQ